MRRSCIIKGDICYSENPTTLATLADGYIVCTDGISAGVYAQLPAQYMDLPLQDYSGKLVLPGLCDLHMHAPQYAFRALGMDLELLEWLDTHTFPEEAKYADLDYAQKAYSLVVEELKKGPNTRSVLFATLHLPATMLLMGLLEESGLVTMVGKVNMDRNSPANLREKSAAQSAADTRKWLMACDGKFRNTNPILTPRFIPSCSDELMGELASIQREFHVPVQSHLSENQGEISWVQDLCPESRFYGDAYDRWGLFGGEVPTIMAHCVWSGDEEIRLMAERGVFVAHCPQSNANLSSGIAPVRKFMEEGVSVGLGSDVAAGCQTSIFRAMVYAIQVSKLRWRLVDQTYPPLTLEEAFYLATKGGGAFFGEVGSFEPGYELDAIILDDENLTQPFPLEIGERLTRAVYMSDDRHIVAKYVHGQKII